MLPQIERPSVLLLAVSTLLLLIASGCSGQVNRGPMPNTGQRVPNVSSDPAKAARACDSSDFILPESVIAGAERLTPEELAQRLSEYPVDQNNQLSLYLALAQDVFIYAEPIAFHLTITNETDHPVIFLRPCMLSLAGTLPAELELDLRSLSGERYIRTGSWANYMLAGYYPLGGQFSMLPPGQSCSVDLSFRWDHTPDHMPEPVPAGDYSMSVILHGRDFGTWSAIGEMEYYDVGAWTGVTEPSNAVTLTILAAETSESK